MSGGVMTVTVTPVVGRSSDSLNWGTRFTIDCSSSGVQLSSGIAHLLLSLLMGAHLAPHAPMLPAAM